MREFVAGVVCAAVAVSPCLVAALTHWMKRRAESGGMGEQAS